MHRHADQQIKTSQYNYNNTSSKQTNPFLLGMRNRNNKKSEDCLHFQTHCGRDLTSSGQLCRVVEFVRSKEKYGLAN